MVEATQDIPKQMQAWVVHQLGGPLTDLKLETIPTPELTQPNDVLVRNYATSLNPTDQKARSSTNVGGAGGQTTKLDTPKILGRDGAGVIAAFGSGVQGFKVGDEVYYAGDITRQGSYAQYTLVDHRIIAHKPKTLDYAQAAALPLTSLTFWEGLYENNKFDLDQSYKGGNILIVAGAGGVGSIGVQLAKYYGLKVTATASRPETIEWVKQLGADHVIDHKKAFNDQVKQLSLGSDTPYTYVFNTHDDSVLVEISKVIAPLGALTIILPLTNRDTNPEAYGKFFYKRNTIHFELMYTRSMYHIEEPRQGDILKTVAELVDAGTIKTTLNKTYEWNDMIEAQKLLESGKTIGKTVVKIE